MILNDKYIMIIGEDIDFLYSQKQKRYNPGAEVLIKVKDTNEFVYTRINIESMTKIGSDPNKYQITGWLSRNIVIGDYFYPAETLFEGEIDGTDTTIYLPSVRRMPQGSCIQREKLIPSNMVVEHIKAENEKALKMVKKYLPLIADSCSITLSNYEYAKISYVNT